MTVDSPFQQMDSQISELHQKRLGVSLSVVMQWFKTMTTNEYIRGVNCLKWEPFKGKLWQRSFHDDILHSKDEYQRVSKYILTNPMNWNDDEFYH
jgi:REP element-mobilizing transposase RayT